MAKKKNFMSGWTQNQKTGWWIAVFVIFFIVGGGIGYRFNLFDFDQPLSIAETGGADEPDGILFVGDPDPQGGQPFSLTGLAGLDQPDGWECGTLVKAKVFQAQAEIIKTGSACSDNARVRVYPCTDGSCTRVSGSVTGYRVDGVSPRISGFDIGDYYGYQCASCVDTSGDDEIPCLAGAGPLLPGQEYCDQTDDRPDCLDADPSNICKARTVDMSDFGYKMDLNYKCIEGAPICWVKTAVSTTCSLSNPSACEQHGQLCAGPDAYCENAFTYNNNVYCTSEDVVECPSNQECKDARCVDKPKAPEPEEPEEPDVTPVVDSVTCYWCDENRQVQSGQFESCSEGTSETEPESCEADDLCVDVDCDDGDACTTDICALGECSNVEMVGCRGESPSPVPIVDGDGEQGFTIAYYFDYENNPGVAWGLTAMILLILVLVVWLLTGGKK